MSGDDTDNQPGKTRPTDRLFFAIYPPAEVATRIVAQAQALQTANDLAGRLVAAERAHVTLRFVGDFPGFPIKVADQAIEAASRIAAQPFDVNFDVVVSFDGSAAHPLTLQATVHSLQLHALHDSLNHALKWAGVAQEADRSYVPHITLQYADRRLSRQRVDPIGWRVTEFCLVHSRLGQAGHTVIRTWPLGLAAFA